MKTRRIVFRSGYFYHNRKFELGSVSVQEGLITSVEANISTRRGDVIVELDGLFVLPGLINSHDHLEFNLFPPLGTPPYHNYVEWANDVRAMCNDTINNILKVPLKYRLLWGAYKNIFSGVTTVIHHNPYYRHFYFDFPVDVFRRYRWIHSLELDSSLKKKLTSTRKTPIFVHLAEGTDALARGELGTLHSIGGLKKNTVIIHGIAIDDQGISLMQKLGIPLVWCPVSNNYLYNATAPADKLIGRVPVVLGTDSAISGGISLLENIRFGQEKVKQKIPDLIEMVTSTPAAIFGLNKGIIKQGALADFLIFDAKDTDPFDAFINLSAKNIGCVIRGGRPIYGDIIFKSYFHQFHSKEIQISVDSQEKFIATKFIKTVSKIRKSIPVLPWNTLGVNTIQY